MISRRKMIKGSALMMGMSLWSNGIWGGKRLRAKSTLSQSYFPLLEISAKDYSELGEKIGKSAQRQIQLGLKRRKKWLKGLLDFAEEDRTKRFEPFLLSLKQNFPYYLEELKGMAKGAGVSFDLLFILNLNPELSAMMRSAREEDCSTVMVRSQDKIILAHNEDGSEQYLDLMFLLRAKSPSGTEFLVLAYPGIMPGNGPGINSYGIIHTCNYLGNKKWQEGVPRYFLDRAMLEAKSMDQAISFATHPSRAYSQAHNLVSISENRALMIESSVEGFALKEVNGIIYRTNHYLFPEMKAEPQFASYKAGSLPRFKSLELALKDLSPELITSEQVHYALSNHETHLISPCRHKSKVGLGATLGMFLFDSASPQIRFYYQAPCKKVFQEFPRPER